jgi:hypothetical protein
VLPDEFLQSLHFVLSSKICSVISFLQILFNKESLNILLENSGMLGEDEVIDLSKAKKSLGEMENELNKLLRN